MPTIAFIWPAAPSASTIRRIGGLEVTHLEALVLPVTAADGIGRWAMVFAFFH